MSESSKVSVFVGMYGGFIDELSVYKSEALAIKAWTEYTGYVFKDYKNDEDLLHGKDCEGSDVFVVEIQE